MARTNLASMSVDALLKLRHDIGEVLSQRADQLKDQLYRLGSGIGVTKRGRRSALKGRKAPIKYRDREGNTWAGRGAQPIWLREKVKAGAKLELPLRTKPQPERLPSHVRDAARPNAKGRACNDRRPLAAGYVQPHFQPRSGL
jgi:DNA-binding protein H-NS